MTIAELVKARMEAKVQVENQIEVKPVKSVAKKPVENCEYRIRQWSEADGGGFEVVKSAIEDGKLVWVHVYFNYMREKAEQVLAKKRGTKS